MTNRTKRKSRLGRLSVSTSRVNTTVNWNYFSRHSTTSISQIQKEYITKQKEQLDEQDEKKKQARQALGFDQQSEYDRQLELLQQALYNKYITQQDHEQRVQQLKKESFMKQAEYYTNLFSNAVTSLQNAEMANVDAKYDAEI